MIDDDKHFVEIYKTRLEREGFRVLTAFQGEEGIKAAIKENPHLIILDSAMPKMDGFEVLQELRGLLSFTTTPIFMLSTLSAKDRISRALELGATEYLVKAHTTPGELVKKIKQTLSSVGS